jgi:hypothetical protein
MRDQKTKHQRDERRAVARVMVDIQIVAFVIAALGLLSLSKRRYSTWRQETPRPS